MPWFYGNIVPMKQNRSVVYRNRQETIYSVTIKEYISRVGKSRGFGIQSPWAYRFVTEVIGERLPYYAYEDIDRSCRTKRERKYRKLLLRISNFVYPAPMEVIDVHDAVKELPCVVERATAKGVIVIEGINKDKGAKELWTGIKDDCRIGVTFDCYDFGICFLDKEMYKQHYKLNFF